MTDRDFHHDHDEAVYDLPIEWEQISIFDDILDDGREREKHRTLMDGYIAFEEDKKTREQED
jgi:hypothetical protein